MIVTRCLPMGIICNLWFEKYIPLHKFDEYHHHQLYENETLIFFFFAISLWLTTWLSCLSVCFLYRILFVIFGVGHENEKQDYFHHLFTLYTTTWHDIYTNMLYVCPFGFSIDFFAIVIISCNPAFKVIIPWCNVKYTYMFWASD